MQVLLGKTHRKVLRKTLNAALRFAVPGVAMNWLRVTNMKAVSDCGLYDLRGSYANGHFQWRATFLPTDQLVHASADPALGEYYCELHAAALAAEATA